MNGNNKHVKERKMHFTWTFILTHPNCMISECSKLQKRVWSSRKKVSWPTISFRLFAFITSRETRGKPSGSSLFADKKDDTGVMLREGKLATEDAWSLGGGLKDGGMEGSKVSIGGVTERAVV